MRSHNLLEKLSAISFDETDVASRKLNRMIIGNPTLAEDIVRYFRAETGRPMPIVRKTYKGVPASAKKTLDRLSHDRLCVLPV